MKKIAKITVAALVATTAVAGFASSAYADYTGTFIGGNISGQAGKMRITRDVTGVSNPVTNTFTYTIAEASGNPGTVSGYPTSASIVLNGATPTSGTVSGTADLDFTGASFSELGNYYFTVTESNTTDSANYPKDTNVYRIGMQVRNEMQNDVPTGNYEIELISQFIDANGDKDDYEYTSGAVRTYIEATQSTTGAMADANDCFKYSINIPASGSLVSAGDTFKVTTSSTCAGSVENVTAGGSSNFVYLKNGDSVTIGKNGTTNQLPIGATYTIKLEDDKGYQATYYDDVESSTRISPSKTTVAESDSNFNTANVTAIRNDKAAEPNTGILMNIWPFALLVAVAGIGTAYVAKQKQSVK